MYNEGNYRVTRMHISAYICPSDDASGRMMNDRAARSNFVICYGSDTTGQSSTEWDTDGVFQTGPSKRLSDLTDGTSHTALASEVLAGRDDDSADDGIKDVRGVWAEGTSMGAASYTHRNTPNSSVGDALFSPGNCAPAVNMPCSDSAGNTYYAEYASARSRHPGGVNVVFVDGHVSFYTDEVDWKTWQGLSTIAGGETVQADQQ